MQETWRNAVGGRMEDAFLLGFNTVSELKSHDDICIVTMLILP